MTRRLKELNSILENMSTFDRYRNISLSLKNVMFVVMYCLPLVLNRISGGNQSVCRICILIEEMLERVVMPGRLECNE